MSTIDDDKNTELVQAALLLGEFDPPSGMPPELDELWDWHFGEVAEPRASEIQAHVARDPEVYAMWRDMRQSLAELNDVESEVKAHVPESLSITNSAPAGGLKPAVSGWFGNLAELFKPSVMGGGFATAAVILIAVGVGLKSTPPKPDIWADWATVKSSTAVAISPEELPELQAYLAGMRDQMWDLSLPPVGPDGGQLPRKVPECISDDSDCVGRRESLQELGRLSVFARIECVLAAESVRDNRQRASALLQVLEPQASVARLIGPLRGWVEAGDSAKQRCSAVQSLIARGLTAQRLLSKNSHDI